MNTTHSISLRNYMVEKGYFECIYHFNETPIFSNASVSVVIFKYVKSIKEKRKISITKYYKNRALTPKVLSLLKEKDSSNPDIEKFTVPPFEKNKRWLLTNTNEIQQIQVFEKSCSTLTSVKQDLFNQNVINYYPTIGDICDIGNGMVSGLDKAFQLNGEKLNEKEIENTINVIKAKDLEPFLYNNITKYIFLDDIESEDILKDRFPAFYQKLLQQKERLEKRYQYNRKIDFWEWVFLRNYNLFNTAVPRIFVPCKERISNKDYFRFSFVPAGIFPTQDVTAIFPKAETKESIFYILSFLNHRNVFNWLKNKGIIKGNIVEFSEKPISSIPFRVINWANDAEVELHREITEYTKLYLEQKDELALERVNELLDELLNKK